MIALMGQSTVPVSGTMLVMIAALLLFFVVLVIIVVFLFKRVSRAASGGMGADIGGLQKLGTSAQLTPEEAAKVAAALSRKMSKLAEEKMRATKGASLEQLALEAQVIAAQGKAAKPAEPPPSATPKMPESMPEEKRPSAPATTNTAPQPSKPAIQLPPRLEHVAHRSATELDDLVNAGFLTREDVELVLAARKASQ